MTEAIKFADTLDIINQDELPSAAQGITPDMSVSTSSEFRDSEIPTVSSVCRICLQSDFDETTKCISPCSCRGSMSKVHRSCLEKWLLQASSTVCEICRFEYKTRRIMRYSLLGSIKEWFFSSETKDEVREFFYDGCVLLIMLPFIAIFSYAGFSLTEHIFNVDRQIQFDLAYRVISFSACWSILCADFFFCFWTSCRVQYHITNWYNFYTNNQWIVVELEPETSM